jgi:hypothetical protein
MSRILKLSGTLLLFGLLAASMGPAKAAQLALFGSAPHLCVVVEGANTANGTPVIAYSCSGGPEDQWEFINGQFQGIGTANGKSMCLDVKGNGTTPGTLVDLWPCNGQQNQQWGIGNAAADCCNPNSTWIMSQSTDLCLDSAGGPSAGGGTQLVINDCSVAASQNWNLEGVQLQVNANAPYVCASVEGGNTAKGTPVIAYSCDDGPASVWSYVEGQFYGIGTENGTSKCLTGNGTAIGSLVDLSTCTGAENQQWILEYTDSSPELNPNSQIWGVASMLCIDSSGGPSSGGGTQLVLNTCKDVASQSWNLR